MVAHAGTAAGVDDDAPGVEENLDEPFFQRLAVDRPGGRQYDGPHGHFLALQDIRGKPQVLDAGVCAAPEEGLVDGRALDLVDGGVVVHRVRLGDGGDQVTQVVVKFPGVDRVVVGPDGLPLVRLCDGLDEVQDLLVRGADGVLGADLDTHVAEGHPLGQGHLLDGGSVELDGHVVGPVGLYIAGYLEDQVLRRNTLLELARHGDLHRFGDTEPDLPRRPGGGHLTATYSRGESAESTVSAGVAVASNDDQSREGEALLAHDLVADPALARHVVEVPDPLFLDHLADLHVVLGVLVRRRRDGVIQDEHQVVGFPDLIHADLLENAPDRRGVVVAHAEVGLDDDDLTGRDGLAGRLAKYLFSECLSHADPLLLADGLFLEVLDEAAGLHDVHLQVRDGVAVEGVAVGDVLDLALLQVDLELVAVLDLAVLD